MQSVSGIGRVAAIGAVLGAIVLVAIVLFGSGAGAYTVHAKFINASQLVKGNPVQVAGTQVGSVEYIALTPDGQADVTISVNEDYAPLREGTTATIRQFSLSGIANRYVDLTLPPGPDADHPEIPDEGEIGAQDTEEPVDLDQVFNTFDPVMRVAVQDFFQQSAIQYRGRGDEANRGYQYLNPALSTGSRLFRELNRDTAVLEAFLVDSAKLVTTVAQRRDDLAALIGNLNETTRALGNEKLALAQVIARFPAFMRTANTTFVNLRSTLDKVDPLVRVTEPAARTFGEDAGYVERPGAGNDLQELLPELRAFVDDAKPAVADLDRIIRHPRGPNDLIDLQETFPPLKSAALERKQRSVNPASVPFAGNNRDVRGKRRNVGEVRGAFPEMTVALRGAAPVIAQGRPYTPDLWGWFDDFSHPGGYDAVQGVNRAELIFNEASGMDAATTAREEAEAANTPALDQYKKCPGASELPAADGSNIFSINQQRQLDCRERDRPTGDYSDPNNPYDRVGPGGNPPSR